MTCIKLLKNVYVETHLSIVHGLYTAFDSQHFTKSIFIAMSNFEISPRFPKISSHLNLANKNHNEKSFCDYERNMNIKIKQVDISTRGSHI